MRRDVRSDAEFVLVGCGRQVAPDEGRGRQMAWMDAFDGGSRAQRTVASNAIFDLEEIVRRYGSTAAADELPEWRDRALQLERMGVSTETVSYVETTPPRSVAAGARRSAVGCGSCRDPAAAHPMVHARRRAGG